MLWIIFDTEVTLLVGENHKKGFTYIFFLNYLRSFSPTHRVCYRKRKWEVYIMDTQQSNVFTSSTNSSDSIPKEDKALEREITTIIRNVLSDLKTNFKLQKVQVKKNVRDMGIANKQEILKYTHERLQNILTDAKQQIQLSMDKIGTTENKEESVVVPIEEEKEKNQENE